LISYYKTNGITSFKKNENAKGRRSAKMFEKKKKTKKKKKKKNKKKKKKKKKLKKNPKKKKKKKIFLNINIRSQFWECNIHLSTLISCFHPLIT